MRRISALLFTSFAITGTCVLGLAGTAAASGGTTYTPEAPNLDTIEGGPWNTSQGNAFASAYPFSDLLPTFTPGGPETTIGGVSEPNVAVYPGEKEPTGVPYPSGVAGTPGPLSGYCNKEESENETGTPVALQPTGTKLPFSPYYFPDVVRNADGSLTGYFDYRPKDADEAITVAKSTNNGESWTTEGKALEQNHGYCPTADTNDDGQGHPFVMSTGSSTDLYALQRQAGDNPGIGLLVHQVNPSATNPLSGLPASQSIGIDPNTFVTAATTVPSTGGVAIPVSNMGTAGSPEQIVNGSYEDVPAASSEPSSSTIINCTGPTSAPSTEGSGSLTGCTSGTGGPVELHPGDDLIQVIAKGNPNSTSGSKPCKTIGSLVPSGPNIPSGKGGLEALCYTQPSTPVAPITDFLWGSLAPNRVYMNGETVYCAALSSGRVKLEQCTTTGAPFNYTEATMITADPIIPPETQMTTGLEAPDGIIGSLGTGLTTYNGKGVPSGANVVLYTEKILNYYIFGVTNGYTSASKENYEAGEVKLPLTQPTETTPGQFLNYQPSPTTTEPLPCHEGGTSCASCPSTSTGCSLTVYVGTQFRLASEHKTKENGPIQSLSCAGWLPASADTGGSPQPSAGSVDLEACKGSTTPPTGYEQMIVEESDVGGPNAAIVPYSVLEQTGEGKNGKTSGPTELFGNNEDLSLLRAAYTTNGVEFHDLGAISGTTPGAVNNKGEYTGISNPYQQASPKSSTEPTTATTEPTSPTDLTPGSADEVELRYIGSRGTIITNPNGTYGMFLSGSWASDGDSDAFNQIFYTESSNGEEWSTPKVVLSTEYEFKASREQDEALAHNEDKPLGVSAYYSGRAYGPAVVQNPNGSLTMVFSGYRIPKPITAAGTELGTGSSKYKVGAKDPALYRNILTMQLKSATSPGVANTTSVSSSDGGTGVVGAAVTYTATVAPVSPGTGTPTGTVVFSDSHGPIAGCAAQPLNKESPDVAVCETTHETPAGADTVTAKYSGDSNYTGSSGTTGETVEQAPAITSGESATFTEGTEGSFTVAASGYPVPGITESGTLPAGVTFDESTGVLSGTPTQAGIYHIAFDAGNGVGSNAEQHFTLTVDAAPGITSAESATFTEGTEGSFTVAASGYPVPGITESGTLPAGVTFDESTGVLSGTPTQDGEFPITFTAGNGVGANAVQHFTLTVDSAPAITSAASTIFTEGSKGSFTVTATGTPKPTITETGTLPEGVTFDESTDQLSGTPTQQGVYPISFTATNEVGFSTQGFTLTVGAACGSPGYASGSPLQNIAQTEVFLASTGWDAHTSCSSPATITYTGTSTGQGLEEFGNNSGELHPEEDQTAYKSSTGTKDVEGQVLDWYVGTDDPPTAGELSEAQAAAGAKALAEVTIPVAQSPVAVLLSLPTGCLIRTGSKVDIDNTTLPQLWEGTNAKRGSDPGGIQEQGSPTKYAIDTWGAFLYQLGYKESTSSSPAAGEFYDAGGATGCEQQIKPQVRSVSSGTSYVIKNYFGQINFSVWQQYADDFTNWPTSLKVESDPLSGGGGSQTNESGGNLAANTAANPGSVGYAAAADAATVANGGFTSSATSSTFGTGSGGTSTAHQILWAQVQDNGKATTGEAYADPAREGAEKEVANCESTKLTPYDSGFPYSYTDSWYGIVATDPNIAKDAGAGDYSLCALTYDLVWHHYSNVNLYGKTGTAHEVANSVKDLFEYIVGQGQAEIQSHYYTRFPTEMQTHINNAVNPGIGY